MTVWDEITKSLLRQMWADGIPTAEIARRLNTSKNSVVGKAHRLDLPARPSPIRRGGPNPSVRSLPRPTTTLPPLSGIDATMAVAARPIPPPRYAMRDHSPASKPTFNPPPPPAAPVYRRPSVECCWPLGEPGTKSFRFCSDPSISGKPYCHEHAKLAYVRVRDQREDAA